MGNSLWVGLGTDFFFLVQIIGNESAVRANDKTRQPGGQPQEGHSHDSGPAPSAAAANAPAAPVAADADAAVRQDGNVLVPTVRE